MDRRHQRFALIVCTAWCTALQLTSCSQAHGGSSDQSVQPAAAQLLALSSGQFYSCAVTVRGEVRCWGDNQNGQLGDGTTTPRSTPVIVPGIVATDVVTGLDHTCALLKDGDVACWGSNEFSQTGTTGEQQVSAALLVPTRVAGLHHVVSLTAAPTHTCALTHAGDIECFGLANQGSGIGYGDGKNGKTGPTPFRMPRVEGAVALRSGSHTTCAITAAHEAQCWGLRVQPTDGPNRFTLGRNVQDVVIDNDGAYCLLQTNGRVACGGTSAALRFSSLLPQSSDGSLQQVSGLRDITAIAGSLGQVCARASDGRVYCWGKRSALTHSSVPYEIPDISATLISSGTEQACASTADGLRCWGNVSAARGDGATLFVSKPESLHGISNATQVSVGFGNGCARLKDGRVSCWGYGVPFMALDQPAPQRPTTLLGVQPTHSVALAYGTGCLLSEAGAVSCFDRSPQTTDKRALQAHAELDGTLAITAAATRWGHVSACALGKANDVHCISLVDPTLDTPAPDWMTWPAAPSGTVTKAIAYASDLQRGFGCRIAADNGLTCFATGGLFGLVRHLTTNSNATLPFDVVDGLPKVLDLALDLDHACAITPDHHVLCWGNGDRHALAIDATDTVPTPTEIGIDDAVQIATAPDHTCVVHSTGRVSCFGSNQVGQLGNGKVQESAGIVAVAGLEDAVQVSVATATSCAVEKTGAVQCWGTNTPGTWPDTADDPDVPVDVLWK